MMDLSKNDVILYKKLIIIAKKQGKINKKNKKYFQLL